MMNRQKHSSKKQRSRQSNRIIHISIRQSNRSTPISYVRSKNNKTTNSTGISIPLTTVLNSSKTKLHFCHNSQLQSCSCQTWANSTDYATKQNRKEQQKKKHLHRRCLILIVIMTLILIALLAILFSIFLLKPNTSRKAKHSHGSPILRWNSTGLTVAGMTGQCGNASNKLCRPRGLYMDWSNALYIAERSNNRIQKYLRDASFGETVAGQASGLNGTGSNFLNNPTDIKIDLDGNMYIADRFNHRVQLWNQGASSGVTIAGMTGILGNLSTQLWYPAGIVLDVEAKGFYISDNTNHRIMYYRTGVMNGTVAAGGNSAGFNTNQLYYPNGFDFDVQSNSLIIPNYSTHNIVRWTLNAKNWTLVAGDLNGTHGNTSYKLSYPSDGVLDPMGNVYVADQQNHRIQFFYSGEFNGTTIVGSTGSIGSTGALFNEPTSILLDNQLNLYVSDTENHRIQKFFRY